MYVHVYIYIYTDISLSIYIYIYIYVIHVYSIHIMYSILKHHIPELPKLLLAAGRSAEVAASKRL